MVHFFVAAGTVGACSLGATARAEVVPPRTELPQVLTLDQAIEIFRARGFDLLIAEANVRSAEGDLKIAGAVPNPVVSAGYGRVLNYSCSNPDGTAIAGCSPNQYTVGISDNAAIEDSLSGKRGLRKDVARAALAAARMARVDAQRSLEFQIKQAYFQVALARAALDFAKDVAEASSKTLDLNKLRYPRVIDEGALARVETAKLEADQAVDQAVLSLRAARVSLAFLLGIRGQVPDFEVEKDALKYVIPMTLARTDDTALMRSAFEHRPDLLAFGYQQDRAAAAIKLAKRQVFPDIALGVNYTQTGTGQSAIQPPTVSFSLTAPIPLFYQQQGEIRKAEADYDTQSLQRAKTEAQVVADVESAYVAYQTSRRLVERMESALLDRARKARDITKVQFEAGSAPLMDYLDAQRTYIATNLEYLQDLASYWTAVAQLEQAVGMELRK